MKLSIAIPAYNAAKSLERTARSILAQTFKDFEVLIVNNGSLDCTGDIAREIATEDSRIKVFDVYPNVGGYGARLYAWARAKSDYIATVDADDIIEPDMYERMIKFADANNLDVVECDWVEGNATPLPESCHPDIYETKKSVMEKVIYPTFVSAGNSAYTWNKIYRNQYDFSQWVIDDFGSYEDLIHNLQLFRPVRRYGHVHAQFYHYMPNEGSVTRNYSKKRIDQFLSAIKARRKLLELYGFTSYEKVLDKWVVNDAWNGIISALRANGLSFRERVRLARRMALLPEVGESLKRLRFGTRLAAIVGIVRLLCFA